MLWLKFVLISWTYILNKDTGKLGLCELSRQQNISNPHLSLSFAVL